MTTKSFLFNMALAAALTMAISGILVLPQLLYAAGPTATAQGAKTEQGATSEQGTKSEQSPSNYLSNLYVWFLGFVGIAAMFAIVMGGVMYMFAGANLTKTEQAKKWITNAIWGIVLAAVSVLLLRTINPDLVRGFNLETVIQNAINKVK